MSMSKSESAMGILTGEDAQGQVAPLKATDLRSSIFAKAQKPMRRPYTFNGVQVEFLQPLVGAMFSQQSSDPEEKKSFIVQSMIANTVAPGTSDRVFEDTDYDSIMEMPMSGDIQQVVKIVQELMDIGVDDKVKN